MAPKEPTRAQLSSKLAYQSHTPAFILKLQRQVAGIRDSPDPEESEDPEFEYVGAGRPPIPKRPAIPERPPDDPGSADEDDGDEKPQVVVLKEGKHLTQREAENVKRKEKGLPPLPEPDENKQEAGDRPQVGSSTTYKDTAPGSSKSQHQGLSFSSSKGGIKSSAVKRKAVGLPSSEEKGQEKKGSSKKAKKSSKILLSFGDDT